MRNLFIFLLFAVFISCANENNKSSNSKINLTSQNILKEISNFEQISSLFQSDSGKVRLITLLSPT